VYDSLQCAFPAESAIFVRPPFPPPLQPFAPFLRRELTVSHIDSLIPVISFFCGSARIQSSLSPPRLCPPPPLEWKIFPDTPPKTSFFFVLLHLFCTPPVLRSHFPDLLLPLFDPFLGVCSGFFSTGYLRRVVFLPGRGIILSFLIGSLFFSAARTPTCAISASLRLPQGFAFCRRIDCSLFL